MTRNSNAGDVISCCGGAGGVGVACLLHHTPKKSHQENGEFSEGLQIFYDLTIDLYMDRPYANSFFYN
jgi:hypothetical protein